MSYSAHINIQENMLYVLNVLVNKMPSSTLSWTMQYSAYWDLA